MDQRAKDFAQKQKDHKLTIGERITVGMENVLHRISDRVLSPGQGREGSVGKNDVGGKAEGVHEEPNKNGSAEAGDEESVPTVRGRFTVTVKRKGATKSVAAEVRLRPKTASGKKDKEKEKGDAQEKVWEIQLDCLVCENPLD